MHTLCLDCEPSPLRIRSFILLIVLKSFFVINIFLLMYYFYIVYITHTGARIAQSV